MNKDELKSILEQHRLWLDGDGGKRADLKRADLKRADLKRADLKRAKLQRADMRGADMRGAELQDSDMRANLQYADLKRADLQRADMRGADMRGAELQDSDMRGADMRGADIDYACLPLWCGSKGMIVDRRIAAQIAAHFCALVCDDADYQAARTAILEFAKSSHRAMDLGLLEEREK